MSSERRKALAEAVVAKEQVEYEIMIARKINERKQLETDEGHRRLTERAEHEHELAILKAKKTEAMAKAKLAAIEQPISDDEKCSQRSLDGVKTHIATETKRQRTEAWLSDLPLDLIGATQTHTRQSLSSPLVSSILHPISRFPKMQPRTNPSLPVVIQRSQSKDICYSMGLMSATNKRLASALAKLSLPKCHPDIFSGDPTMFYPWRSAFKGMLENCKIGPTNDINYRHMYTSGAPQKLADTYGRRQHNLAETFLKKLWIKLEDRFGNSRDFLM